MTWLRRAVVILFAGLLVSLGALTLGQTPWANHVRSRQRQFEARHPLAVANPPNRPIRRPEPRVLQSLAKFAVYSGVPGILTLGVLAVTRRRSRATGAPSASSA